MKYRLIAYLLCCVLLIAPALAESGDDAVAWVDGEPISASLVEERLAAAGSPESGATEEDQEALLAGQRAALLEELVMEQVCLNEAEDRGILLEGELLAEAEQRYERTIGTVESYVLSSYPDLEGEALDEVVDSLLESIGASREQYRRSAERSVLLDALDEALLAEAPQPDEADIQAFYDELYAEQKALFDEDENAFEAALLQDEIVVYRPVDLKLIQKASFMFDELAKSLIASASLTDAEEANAMMMDQYLRLADEVDPIYQALVAGEMTFAQVLEDLEPGSSEDVNYFHPSSTRFDEEYYQRANAFTTVGEVSTAYVIPYGYAILYYAGDLEACEAVPLEEVRAQIAAQLQEESSAEFLAQRKAALLAEADVRYAETGK